MKSEAETKASQLSYFQPLQASGGQRSQPGKQKRSSPHIREAIKLHISIYGQTLFANKSKNFEMAQNEIGPDVPSHAQTHARIRKQSGGETRR